MKSFQLLEIFSISIRYKLNLVSFSNANHSDYNQEFLVFYLDIIENPLSSYLLFYCYSRRGFHSTYAIRSHQTISWEFWSCVKTPDSVIVFKSFISSFHGAWCCPAYLFMRGLLPCEESDWSSKMFRYRYQSNICGKARTYIFPPKYCNKRGLTHKLAISFSRMDQDRFILKKDGNNFLLKVRKYLVITFNKTSLHKA